MARAINAVASKANINAVEDKAAQRAELKRLREIKKQQAEADAEVEAQAAALAATEAKALRAANAKAKREANIAAAAVKPEFAPVVEEASRMSKAQAAADTLLEALGIKVPSASRVFVALVISLAISAGAGLAIGNLTAYAIAGAVSLGAGSFVVFAIWVLGMILALLAGWKIGNVVCSWVMDGRADADYAKAKSRVTGWFKFGANSKVVAA